MILSFKRQAARLFPDRPAHRLHTNEQLTMTAAVTIHFIFLSRRETEISTETFSDVILEILYEAAHL